MIKDAQRVKDDIQYIVHNFQLLHLLLLLLLLIVVKLPLLRWLVKLPLVQQYLFLYYSSTMLANGLSHLYTELKDKCLLILTVSLLASSWTQDDYFFCGKSSEILRQLRILRNESLPKKCTFVCSSTFEVIFNKFFPKSCYNSTKS